jgi:DNA-binding NarL/FixJ family response regulator
MIDVIITSDIRIYCEGLGQILSSTGEVNVIGTAGNCEAAIEKISAVPPDVLLLDMTMAGSCQLARQIPQVSSGTKIVALAVSYDESNIVRCAEVGVTCFVPRDASGNELIEAIRKGVRGECYCPPKIAACLLKKMQHLACSSDSKKLTASVNNHGAPSVRPGDRHTRLTRRELQIARLLAEGLSNKQIARDLSIEVSTVKNHVHNVLVKLEVSNRGQAVFYLQETSFSMDLNLSN